MERKPEVDVAVYAPLAAPLYGDGAGHTGGAELQSQYLARALADAGLRVRHIVEPDPGQTLLSTHAGVEPVALGRRPGARRLARYRGIAYSLAQANARVYVQRSAGYETGVVAAWARAHGRPFVFSSSSDGDFVTDPEISRQTGGGLEQRRIMVQYRLGLRLATQVVVQTEGQLRLARERFGLHARVLPSFAEAAPASPRTREAFLWVGGVSGIKNPLAYVELARRVPEARFWMVATPRDVGRDLFERLLSGAAEVPNLELMPARPRGEIFELYRRAVAVVNTSILEGFPNTFLEAWSHGTPALSLRVDPDGVIAANRLGAVADGSIARLAAAAREQWAARGDDPSETTRAYIRRTHDPSVVGPRWAELVEELLRRGS